MLRRLIRDKPPKRGRPQKQPTTIKVSAPSKRSKKASNAGHARSKAHNDDEILSAFRLFAIPAEDLDDPDEAEDEDGEGVLKIGDVRRCLTCVARRFKACILPDSILAH